MRLALVYPASVIGLSMVCPVLSAPTEIPDKYKPCTSAIIAKVTGKYGQLYGTACANIGHYEPTGKKKNGSPVYVTAWGIPVN